MTRLETAQTAFYSAQRSPALPLAVNDVVTVTTGDRPGARGWVISLQALLPEPVYRIEFDDGSDALVALRHLALPT